MGFGGTKSLHLQLKNLAQFSLLALCLSSATLAAAADMNFNEALHLMTENNVNVRVQQSKVDAAEYQLLSARGKFLPRISAGYSEQSGGGLDPWHTYSASASLNLFRWGGDLANMHAAQFDQKYQHSLYQQTYLDAEGQAAEALFDLIERAQTVELYRKSERNARNYLEIAQQRFKKSFLSAQELDKVALDASNAEGTRTDSEIQFNSAKSAVESLLNHSNVQISWPWEKAFHSDDIQQLLRAQTTMMDRPDYRAAQAIYEAESNRSRSKFRNIFPSLDLNFSESQGFIYGMPTSNGWVASASLSMPLFNGFQDYADYHLQETTRYKAEYRLHQLERDITAQQQAARENFRLALEQFESRSQNLVIAQRLLDADAARFKMGRADANELNIDLTRVTQAQLLSIQGIRHAHSAYVQLLHAVGRQIQGP